MSVSIRKFTEEDIPYKVKWINDDRNNEFLHYDLPLREDKTLLWFRTLKDRSDRVDLVITYNDKPVGLIGLLSISNKDAEYYICVGNHEYKGKGIATKATELLIKYAKDKLKLYDIYLYTEVDNKKAQALFDKLGFKKLELLKNHLYYNGNYVSRYLYSLEIKDV